MSMSHPRRLLDITGARTPPHRGPPKSLSGDHRHHLNTKLREQRREPEALSQPVDPGSADFPKQSLHLRDSYLACR